jgi:hypothetical protein
MGDRDYVMMSARRRRVTAVTQFLNPEITRQCRAQTLFAARRDVLGPVKRGTR